MVRNFVFVETDKRGRTKAHDRKRIRSKCMAGKNWRIGVGPAPLSVHQNETQPRRSGSSLVPLSSLQQITAQSTSPSRNQNGSVQSRLPGTQALDAASIPRAPSSDFSLLADRRTDEHERLHLIHFLTRADQLFYPLELCIDFDLAQSNGIRWILHDQTYLYFTLFFSSAINDAVLRQPYGKQTLHYLGRTIASLNAKLARNELEDPTVSIVSSLVIVSAALTDYNASKTHFEGLGQMVQLRGGLGAFRHNMGLYLKLTRVDFAYTLHTGQPPLFRHDGLPLEHKDALVRPPQSDNDSCTFNDNSKSPEPFDVVPAPSNTHVHHLCVLVALDADSRVSSVFSDLRDLASEFNQQSRMRDSDFKLVISRIQYRLLSLSNTLDDSLSECLRLAMLAFLACAFEIPEKSGRRYPYLSQTFRTSCLAILDDARISEMWPNLVIWLLMVGAMSLYGVDEDWLCNKWRAVVPATATWNDTRARLKGLLWIDVLHDKLGEETFQALSCRDSKTVLKITKSSAWWMSGWGVCPLEI